MAAMALAMFKLRNRSLTPHSVTRMIPRCRLLGMVATELLLHAQHPDDQSNEPAARGL